MADIVQALPSSNDGYIYIFLGVAYTSGLMELQIHHPVYCHDGTGIRRWRGAESYTPDEHSASTLSGSGTNYFYAFGGTATLMCTGTGTNTQWGSTVLCTVPEGYRPWTQLYFPCQVDGAYAQSDKYIIIATDGKVTLQNAGGTQLASVYRASCTWAYHPTGL
jgi:hypothetical protein